MIGPFMKVFGSKWGASKKGRYPAPRFHRIYEPWAGGGGYSCANHECDVYLRESHPELHQLWSWLIRTASESDVRDIPIFEPGVNLLSTGLSAEQAILVKWWQRTNNHGTKTFITSPWSDKPGQWTASTRARIAEQVSAIKHWRLGPPKTSEPMTIFADPVYQYNYKYGCPTPDYGEMASWLKGLADDGSQVIACEARGKNGETPNYLPFAESHRQITVNRNRYSSELIWTS